MRSLIASKLATATAAGKAAFVGGVAVIAMGAAGAAVAIPTVFSPAGSDSALVAPSATPSDDDSQGDEVEATASASAEASEAAEAAAAPEASESPKVCPSTPADETADEAGDPTTTATETPFVRGDGNEDGHPDCGLHKGQRKAEHATKGDREDDATEAEDDATESEDSGRPDNAPGARPVRTEDSEHSDADDAADSADDSSDSSKGDDHSNG